MSARRFRISRKRARKHDRKRAIARVRNHAIIYRGPSLLDDAPIVVLAVYTGSNRKTGKMLQTYILRADMNPLQASKSGGDFSICGNCPARGHATANPTLKQAENRWCYVFLGQGPLQVFNAFERGNYRDISGDASAIAELGRGRMVRLGTYGDPAVVPGSVWDALLRDAKGHTGYSHQATQPGADWRKDLCMRSVTTLAEAQEAWRQAERTFRIIPDVAAKTDGEVLCPASKEAGFRSSCAKCALCAGTQTKAKSVAIVVHGTGAMHLDFASARQ